MGVLGGIVRFFQDGGVFMYPILFVFALGAAIALERWTYLTMSGASNRSLWKKIVPYLKAGNFLARAQEEGSIRKDWSPDRIANMISIVAAGIAVSLKGPMDEQGSRALIDDQTSDRV